MIHVARKYASGTQVVPTGDVATTIVLANTTDVQGTIIDTSTTNALTATVSGFYLATYSLEFSAGANFRRCIVAVNGSLRLVQTHASNAGIAPIFGGSGLILLSAGDVVTLLGSSSGATGTVGTADAYRSSLSLAYLDGGGGGLFVSAGGGGY